MSRGCQSIHYTASVRQVTRNRNVCFTSVNTEKWYRLSFLVGAITESPVVIDGVWWVAGTNLLVISSCQLPPCLIAHQDVAGPPALSHCPTVLNHAPIQSGFRASHSAPALHALIHSKTLELSLSLLSLKLIFFPLKIKCIYFYVCGVRAAMHGARCVWCLRISVWVCMLVNPSRDHSRALFFLFCSLPCCLKTETVTEWGAWLFSYAGLGAFRIHPSLSSHARTVGMYSHVCFLKGALEFEFRSLCLENEHSYPLNHLLNP